MKIVCVSGGSYKSFYLNHFLKIKRCDLLIFNFGIIYDYVLKNSNMDFEIVKKELINLSTKLKCVVVAGVNIVGKEKTKKSLIVASGNQICMPNLNLGVKVCLNAQNGRNNAFVVGGRSTDFGTCNKIILLDQQIAVDVKHCSYKKIYIFLNKHGVTVVHNKRLKKHFYKVSILNF